MDILAFVQALDNFALVADMIGMLKWESAMAHKAHCLRAATHGGNDKMRSQMLGVVYDEMCRASWCERSRRQEEGFDVDTAATKWSVELFEEAKITYDQRFGWDYGREGAPRPSPGVSRNFMLCTAASSQVASPTRRATPKAEASPTKARQVATKDLRDPVRATAETSKAKREKPATVM